ncbi:MAG: sulfatase-like hydrolase/transferase [Anaerolineales bacterium]|jgi:choline-sulfatase|nr:sulfatase-like hydrolase/transferase [Anaerolineales bacterium]
MPDRIGRRDFLKLAAFASIGMLIKQPSIKLRDGLGKPNILVILFDALSAYHLDTYGYNRLTTPNLSRLLGRAIVYHNHYAAGNYTVTGAGSLLTGVLPWKHRALRFQDEVADFYGKNNFFSAFNSYYKITYSHNPHVVRFLSQFDASITNNIPYNRFLISGGNFAQTTFENDDDTANIAWSRTFIKNDDEVAYSLFLSELYRKYNSVKIAGYEANFPRGLPKVWDDDNFLLEHVFDYLGRELPKVPQPFLGYFHFLPPHKPYKTSHEFINAFEGDGLPYIAKTQDPFAPVHSDKFMLKQRMEYDEFILYLDREFGKFFDLLDSSGALDNTIVVFTSDHGELFERGIQGHITPSLYQPVVRIPLMIFEPGRTERADIYERTSAVDMLPTLLHLAGEPPAKWSDGALLPPYGSPEKRNIYTVQAARNDPARPLEHFTIMMVKENYKLAYYSGYPDELSDGEMVQLFDIEKDPEELIDLSKSKQGIASELLSELRLKIKEVNDPFI